jgi:hypothetical protein
MNQDARKPLLTPLEPASEAGIERQDEQVPPKPLVGGSIPSGPATPQLDRGFAFHPRCKTADNAPAHPVRGVNREASESLRSGVGCHYRVTSSGGLRTTPLRRATTC